MEHEVVNLPSASVLAVVRKELVSRKPATKPLAVFADPVFSRDDPRIELLDSRPNLQKTATTTAYEVELLENKSGVSKFGRLRFSREEADGIAALAPPSEILKATDFAATKEMMVSANLQQIVSCISLLTPYSITAGPNCRGRIIAGRPTRRTAGWFPETKRDI